MNAPVAKEPAKLEISGETPRDSRPLETPTLRPVERAKLTI
jgi:hypothetical protein